MVDRDRALDTENGLILDEESGGAHLSSGGAVPTHTGKAGDIYFKTDDNTRWYLEADGSDWIKSGDLYIGGVGANYVHITPQCVGGGDANGD